jgi:phosphoribosylformylglycinamidine cyclo-ligase
VIDLGGTGCAITADGVGSKVLIAQMMDRYDTIGIDCVAMNVNDLLCVGAKPISMVEYIGVQDPHPDMLEAISIGLCEGAVQAEISIPGGEISQIPEVVTGHKDGYGFDLVGMAIGVVALDQVIIGQDLCVGDAIIGIESNGIHSNGLTLARKVLFEQGQYTVDSRLSTLPYTLGEELLRPTSIYVKEVMDILGRGVSVKAMIHITGDGLLNLSRVKAKVGFRLDHVPEAMPIFSLIQQVGGISHEEMFAVFNMGIGFCIIVEATNVDCVLSTVHSHGKRALKIGEVIPDEHRRVFIEPYRLVGQGKQFLKA